MAEVLTSQGITDAAIVRVDDERRIARYTSLDAIPGVVINDHLASERECRIERR